MPKRKPGGLFRTEVLLLNALRERPSYGRALATETEQLGSTVYKAIKRLESLGLVRSTWETPRAPRDHPPRRVYRLTAKGRRTVARS